LQVTSPSSATGAQEPAVVVAVGPRSASSNGSVTVTSGAGEGPSLRTTMVYATGPPATGAWGLTDFTRDRLAVEPVDVVTVSALFVGSGSGVGLCTVAVLERAPVCSSSRVAVTVMDTGSPPGATEPSEQATVLSAPTGAHVPAVVVVVAPVRAGSSTSCTATSVAVEGPSLVTVRTYVTAPPGTRTWGVTVLTTETSAEGVASAATAAVLSAGSGSGVALCTVAVLESVPVKAGARVPVTVIVTGPSAGSSAPTGQDSARAAPTGSQLPWLVVTVRFARAVSSWSSTVTPVAVDGPSFSTVRV
jgi:hypothetical protein